MYWTSLITHPQSEGPNPLHIRWLPEYEVWGASINNKPPMKFAQELSKLFGVFSISANVVVIVHFRLLPIDMVQKAENDCRNASLMRVPIGLDPVEFATSVDSVMMTRNEQGSWEIQLAFQDT